MLCHYAECHYAQCPVLFIIMPSIIMLSVVMQNVVIPNVIVLSVVAPTLQLIFNICKLRLLEVLWHRAQLPIPKQSSLTKAKITAQKFYNVGPSWICQSCVANSILFLVEKKAVFFLSKSCGCTFDTLEIIFSVGKVSMQIVTPFKREVESFSTKKKSLFQRLLAVFFILVVLFPMSFLLQGLML